MRLLAGKQLGDARMDGEAVGLGDETEGSGAEGVWDTCWLGSSHRGGINL